MTDEDGINPMNIEYAENAEIEVIVFLGPSLSLEKAKQILPEALYLSPVKCGDILDVLKLQPKKIAIIDGFFENVAAVWHKEILFAIENKVEVYGASSMGALRAAELADFGMIGIGKIFKDFYQGKLEDDDEVTVVHRPPQSGYAPITDAMVNIRATLESAVRQNIITIDVSEKLIVIAKDLFYKKRFLNKAIEMFEKKYVAEKYSGNNHLIADIEAFKQWLDIKKENFVDQKESDAIELLKVIKKDFYVDKKSDKKICKTIPSSNINLNMTILLHKLLDRQYCEPMIGCLKNKEIGMEIEIKLDDVLLRYVRLLAYTIKTCEKLDFIKQNVLQGLEWCDAGFFNRVLCSNSDGSINREIISFFYGLLLLFDMDILEKINLDEMGLNKLLMDCFNNQKNSQNKNAKYFKIILFCAFIIFNLHEYMKTKKIMLSEKQQKRYLYEITEFLPDIYNGELVNDEQLIVIYFILKDMINNSMDHFLSDKSVYFPNEHYVEVAKTIIFSM